MRVLVLVPFYPSKFNPYGGMFIHEQVKRIIEIDPNIDIDVIKIAPYVPRVLPYLNSKYSHFEPNSLRKYRHDGIEVSIIRCFMLPRNLNLASVSLALTRKVISIMDKADYDIVHAHFAVHTGYAAVKACSGRKAKSIVTIHGSDLMYYPTLNKHLENISKYILANADCVIAISKMLASIAEKKIDSSRVKLLYTGINFDRFKLAERRKRDKVKFIYVGNIVHHKGVFDLVHAFARLMKRRDCALTLCGSGSDCKRLKDLCKKIGVEQVTFLGSVRNEVLPKILANHDILVLPSHREGLGTVLIEALAMGKLVIGSNVGGIPEVITDQVNGYLFRPGDVSDLTAKMELAMKNLDGFEPERLRQSVKEKFCSYANTKSLVQLYRELNYTKKR